MLAMPRIQNIHVCFCIFSCSHLMILHMTNLSVLFLDFPKPQIIVIMLCVLFFTLICVSMPRIQIIHVCFCIFSYSHLMILYMTNLRVLLLDFPKTQIIVTMLCFLFFPLICVFHLWAAPCGHVNFLSVIDVPTFTSFILFCFQTPIIESIDPSSPWQYFGN